MELKHKLVGIAKKKTIASVDVQSTVDQRGKSEFEEQDLWLP